MAEIGLDGNLLRTSAVLVIAFLVPHFVFVSAELSLKQDFTSKQNRSTLEVVLNYSTKILHLSSLKVEANYQHFWPEMKFGWRIIVGTVIGFFGAACGSVGGVGGGGIYVPMLTLIIGFDPKSSTAMSKCMITGAAIASVCYNISLRHPTLELPLIDYDLALLFQPMLVLGISIGVYFNVIFADWMLPVLLVVLFLGTSTKAFLKGVGEWKKETIIKKEAARVCASKASDYKEVESKPLPEGGTSNGTQKESNKAKVSKVPVIKNIYWKELGVLVAVWGIILSLQIAKNSTTVCSAGYWVSNLLQIPVAIGATAYQAMRLYNGRRVIGSRGDTTKGDEATWRVYQLFLYCSCGIFAGLVGGLLGLGGGFILGPLFLEMGVPPQVSSATATFAMMFSSSMSVVEYNFLRRFPISYTLYFVVVATIAAFVGQHLMRRIVAMVGRASLIIFVLAFTNFLSAFSLGGVGISDVVKRIEEKMYMGFENICT